MLKLFAIKSLSEKHYISIPKPMIIKDEHRLSLVDFMYIGRVGGFIFDLLAY